MKRRAPATRPQKPTEIDPDALEEAASSPDKSEVDSPAEGADEDTASANESENSN